MGNKCDPPYRARAMTYDELRDLPIGGYKNSTGCVPNIGGMGSGSGYATAYESGFTYPLNGEFDWLLTGECAMNGGSYGCDWFPGQSNVTGRRIGVQRVAYLGAPSECCLGGIITDSTGRTCAPDMITGKNTACEAVLAKHCAENTNLFSTRCARWRVDNPDQTNAIMTNICSADPFRQECVLWGEANRGPYSTVIGNYCTTEKIRGDPLCRNACVQNPGACNIQSLDYCAGADGDTKYCSCIRLSYNITEEQKKLGGWPKCLSGDCLAYGYKTASEDSATCPNINNTTCNIVQNLTAGGNINLIDNKITQECISQTLTQNKTENADPNTITDIMNQTAGGVPESNQQPTPPPSSQPGQSDPVAADNETHRQYILILVILIISIIALCIAAYAGYLSTGSSSFEWNY